jgi:hypothetical protein
MLYALIYRVPVNQESGIASARKVELRRKGSGHRPGGGRGLARRKLRYRSDGLPDARDGWIRSHPGDTCLMDDYLAKPIQPDLSKVKLAHWIGLQVD